MAKRVLIVDDEPNIIELIRMNLPASEFEVLPSYEGRAAIAAALEQRPDLILLDIMLPDLDGFEVLRALRARPETARIPVLMLTARSEEADKVIGLGLGADDYITKPFGLRELEARVRNALRRNATEAYLGGFNGIEGSSTTKVRVQDLIIDVQSREITKENVVPDLTRTEFAILHHLALHQGQVVSRRELLGVISGDHDDKDTRVIDVHVRNLRKKLGDLDENPRYIETARGLGYRFRKGSE